jgi:hypothetical protein
MVKTFVIGILVALAVKSAESSTVTIQNQCSFQVDLYDNRAVTPLASGASTSRTLGGGYVGMFRHGKNDQATCTFMRMFWITSICVEADVFY